MVKTRFSPSPTGMLHIGNARTALFSALYAIHNRGSFLLRIEDTDAVRSESRYIDTLQNDLHWLGLKWQEGPEMGGSNGPYFQSQRHEIYDRYYRELKEQDKAYPCFCTDQELALQRKLQLSRGHAPRYPGTCLKLSSEEIQKRIEKGMKPALRFRVPHESTIEFTDLVKGPQKFDCYDIGDFIIRRADGSSSFMFCNAIDDSLMGVTHVIRGEDHLTNTPRQLMILKALNLRAPQYSHLSLIVGEDGSPLSKRHGSCSLHDLREQGYLPLAVLNYFARLSHAYESSYLMNMKELADYFHLEKSSRAPARFDTHQLLHWQKEAVMKLNKDEAWEWLIQKGNDFSEDPEKIPMEIIPNSLRDAFLDLVLPNICFPFEAKEWAKILFGSDFPDIEENRKMILENAGKPFFEEAIHATKTHGDNIKEVLDQIKKKLGVSGKNLFMPIRLALTGLDHGPELHKIAKILGKEKMINRFDSACLFTEG